MSDKSDYKALIPEGVGEAFTRKEYEAAVSNKFHWGFSAIKILEAIGAIEEFGKRGKEKLYRVII